MPDNRTTIIVPSDEMSNYHMVLHEREYQDRKWGPQSHTIPEWIAILGEEYGEACMAGNKMYWADMQDEEFDIDRYKRLMHELAQTAAVCLVAMKDLRESYDGRVQGS